MEFLLVLAAIAFWISGAIIGWYMRGDWNRIQEEHRGL